MENMQNDAFKAVEEMLQKKKEENSLKKISEVEDLEKEIEDKITLSEEELSELELYESQEVSESIEVITDDEEAEEVDDSKINIIQAKALDRNRMLMDALNLSTSTYEITLPQSGYSCKLSPLNNKDSFNILNTTSSEYENNRMTYKVIYSKIKEFSCGPMTFDEWLKNTSAGDLESFYYGLYCATFLDEGGFRFTCPEYSCGHVTDHIIRNKSLRQVTNFDEMQKLITRITSESKSLTAMKQFSLLDKTSRIKLKKTGLILELKMPSLSDLLSLYQIFDEKVLRKHNDADMNALLCINGFLIPDGHGNYTPDTDKHDVLNVLDNLPMQDAAALKKAITSLLEKYHVSYTIKSVKCAKCGKEIKNVPVNLRAILFTKIYAMQ